MLLPYFQENTIEAGLDEVGRGCLAGPVVAAAVILPADFDIPLLNDSKKISESKRNALVNEIKSQALAWHVSEVSHTKIDEINILNASFLAMHQALNELSITPELLLIDGNRFTKYKNIPHHCIVKGDGKYASIAAASILAKVYRDELMAQLHQQYPYYGWNKNVGYPTKLHREGIKKHGPCEWHRMSFTLLQIQTELFN